MKTSFAAIALAFIYLVSFVMADHQPSTMGMSADDSSDVSSDQADQAMTSGLRGHTGVGLVTNTITANNNNILVKNSNILLSKSDRVKLAKTIQEATTMTTGDLLGLVSSMTGNQAVLSNSATSNTLGGQVVGLVHLPAAIPRTPSPVVALVMPQGLTAAAPAAHEPNMFD